MKVRIGLTLAAITVAVVLAGCSDDTTGSTEALTLTEVDRESHFSTIGNAIDGRTPPGSGLALSIPLQDSSKRRLGELNVTCIATRPGSQSRHGTCSAWRTCLTAVGHCRWR